MLTIHSLEPLRPWKVEQLGSGYAPERVDGAHRDREGRRRHRRLAARRATTCCACSTSRPSASTSSTTASTLTNTGRPQERDALARHGIDPGRPYVLFVGRITRQKGIIHLVRAIPEIDPDAAGRAVRRRARTRPRSAREMEEGVAEVRGERGRASSGFARWCPAPDVIQLYSHAAVFCCPSVYEPFGIINLEAMACETAVVASSGGRHPGGGRAGRDRVAGRP